MGTETQNVHAFKNGGAKFLRYTAEDVAIRARMIPLAIDARRQRFPEEGRVFEYEGEFIGDARWSEKTRAEIGERPTHSPRVSRLFTAAELGIRCEKLAQDFCSRCCASGKEGDEYWRRNVTL